MKMIKPPQPSGWSVTPGTRGFTWSAYCGTMSESGQRPTRAEAEVAALKSYARLTRVEATRNPIYIP